MRFKGRKVLAAFVAVLALGAVVAASAMAAAPPEFKTGTGENFPVKFEKHGTGEPRLETKARQWILCGESKTTGEITAAKTVSVKMEWTNCFGPLRESQVNSKGSPAGTVVIKGSGSLVFINKAKEQVGIALKLEETTVENPAKEYEFILLGHLVVPITPLNTKTFEVDLPLHAKSAGTQEFTTYENEKGETVSAFPEFDFGGGFETASYVMSGEDAMSLSKALTVATSIAPPLYLTSFGSLGAGALQFEYAESAAVASNGNLWVADTSNNRIEELSSTGSFIETIGWGVSNGKNEAEICTSKCQAGIPGSGERQFSRPRGIAVNSSGDVYVAEEGNNRVQELSPEGKLITKWGSFGVESSQFEWPSGVAIAPNGDVYVVDEQEQRVQEFSSSGTFIETIGWGVSNEKDEFEICKTQCRFGGISGNGNGQFSYPHGIAVAANGDVYVAEEGNARVQEFSSTGTFVTKWGSQGSGAEQLSCPHGIAVGTSGEVFVADECNNRIQEFSAGGSPLTRWGTPGTKEGQFSSPSGVAVASNGNLYVVDKDNGRIQKFE